MRCPSSSITESFVVRLCMSPARARNLGHRRSQVILGRSLNSCREERSEMVTKAVVLLKAVSHIGRADLPQVDN